MIPYILSDYCVNLFIIDMLISPYDITWLESRQFSSVIQQGVFIMDIRFTFNLYCCGIKCSEEILDC